MSSGFTSAGIVRKRMSEIFTAFASAIKEPTDPSDPTSSAFPPQTTLDNPDAYPGDPLVAIATAHAASTHEVWESLEGLQNNLDPSTANESYLRLVHAPRFGISTNSNLSTEDLRALIVDRGCSGVPMASASQIALCVPSVECATVVRSTLQNPVDGMPVNTAMLVIKGEPNWNDLAYALFAGMDFGLFDLVGDVQGVATNSVNDLCYRFQPACRVYAGLGIRARRNAGCGIFDGAFVRQTVAERLAAKYSGCGFGQYLSSSELIAEIGEIEGYVIESIGLQRRAKMLVGKNCADTAAPDVVIDDALVSWSTSDLCGYCRGEMWCKTYSDCIALRPWEFVAFDLAFTAASEVPQPTSCA